MHQEPTEGARFHFWDQRSAIMFFISAKQLITTKHVRELNIPRKSARQERCESTTNTKKKILELDFLITKSNILFIYMKGQSLKLVLGILYQLWLHI